MAELKDERLLELRNKFFNVEEEEKPIKKPLKDHANFTFDFDDTTYSFDKLVLPILNFHKINNINYFTVTNFVKYNENLNELEICRRRFYSKLVNNKTNTCDERIVLNKDTGMMILSDDPFKREGLLLSKEGILSKTVKFKKPKSANEVLFLQNIYYYKNISSITTIIDDINSSVEFPNKKEIKELRYNEYLSNLI